MGNYFPNSGGRRAARDGIFFVLLCPDSDNRSVINSKISENELGASPEFSGEKAREFVSTRLTRIMVLAGRLQPGCNPRQLPVTVNAALFLIGELERVEIKSEAFREIIKEHIDLRQQSDIFHIPCSLRENPTCKGLRAMLFELANAQVKYFCEEEKKFLLEMNTQVSLMVKFSLLARTEKNCKLLSTFCGSENGLLLNELRKWCDSRMFGYQ